MIQQNGYLAVQHIRVRINHNIISTVNLVQGDTAREFHFFFDDYDIPDGAEFRIYIRKPSGCEVYNHCYLQNNEIVVQPTLQMVAEKGQNLGQIQIIKDDKLLNTFVFYLAIEENLIFSSSITSSNEFELINDFIDTARRLIPEIEQTLANAQEQEAERETSENIRKSNENVRINNENERINNENTRIDNETVRNDNEEIRKSNEIERQKNTGIAIKEANTARDKANEATKNANDTAQDIKDKLANGEFSASIHVGDVTTGDAGSEVEITNTGTAKDAVFNFKIPKGDTGESGITTPISGFLSLSVDDLGNLYVHYNDEPENQEFEYDPDTGSLYYITPD